MKGVVGGGVVKCMHSQLCKHNLASWQMHSEASGAQLLLRCCKGSLHAGCDCSSQLSARVYNNKKRVSNSL